VTGLFGAMWYHGSLPDRLVPLSQGSLEEDFQMLRFSLQSSSLCTSKPFFLAKNEFLEGQNRSFRYGESNPGLAGLILSMRAADASHYTITEGC
jgi:hypothetical protein